MQETNYKDIRDSCLLKRRNLSSKDQKCWSKAICSNIRTLIEYQKAKHIASYMSINGEVDLSELWNLSSVDRKNYYFPAIMDDLTLRFLPANTNDKFQLNQYGILEPEMNFAQAILPNQIDLILTPLVAFDQNGMRLGMGKGFYDRTLSKLRPKLLIGAAYEFQKQPVIQPQPWDVKLDAIVTEKTIYWSL